MTQVRDLGHMRADAQPKFFATKHTKIAKEKVSTGIQGVEKSVWWIIPKFLDAILKVRVQQVGETYNLKRHPETKWGIPKA